MSRHVPAVFFLLLAACNDRSHVFPGRLYEPLRACLDPTTSIDVVSGGDPGSSCERKCLAAPASRDGGARQVYVSSMCPPYPPLFDIRGDVPGCEGAIAAALRADTCLADGGSSHPAIRDAGVDAASD